MPLLARDLDDLDDRLSILGEFSSIALLACNSESQEVLEYWILVFPTVYLFCWLLSRLKVN